MKKIVIIFLAVISVYYVWTKNSNVEIPDSAIRFRILANSNSLKDQRIKEEVRDKLQKELYFILKNTTTIEAAREKINNNMSNMKEILDEEMKNKPYSYKIDYGMHEFPEKTYKGIKYDAGEYESLLVTLGEGKGDNWWCVLFPPICVMDAYDNKESDEVEYKSYIKTIIEKYFSK